MKKIFTTLMLIAAAALTFSSCNKVELQGQEPVDEIVTSTVFHITASPIDTKTVFGDKVGNAYPTKWTTNKKVRFAVTHDTGKAVDVTPVIVGDGASATFAPEFADAPASGTIYAFSPVGDFNATPKVPGFTNFTKADESDAIYVTIPSTQTPLANSVDESAQAMAASQTYKDVDTPINMSFHHIVAYGKMAISNFTGTIKSVELQFPVEVAGLSCKYVYETGEIAFGLDSKTISLDATNVTNNTFWFALAPTAGNNGEMKIIVTDSNDDTYTKTIDLTAKALPFNVGKVSSFTANFSGIAKDVKEAVYTWDLTKSSYASASDDLVTWTSAVATMTNARNGSSNTKANNYLGGDNANTRTYSGNILTIAPCAGCEITKVVITATTEGYANPINKDWNNATVIQNGSQLTITPTDGSQSFSVTCTGTTRLTSVQVYYVVAAAKTLTSIALNGTYPTEFNTGDVFSHEGMTVAATYDDETTADVTENASFTGYDMDTPGEQTVTVSYTEVETTKSVQYTITVTAIPIILAEDIIDVPAIGGDFKHTYTAQYFTADDVEVAAVDGKVVTEAIAEEGVISYTVVPNYTTSAKNGTITLQSASNEVTKTINVSQVKSSLSVSAEEIVIPYNATSATFTITSKEMVWNVTATPAENMNISFDKNSGAANNDPQTVTVSSTVEASTSAVQTLGTIEVYRNGNTSDSQKKTITVKKGQAPDASTKYYVKTSTFAPGKYLFVRDNKTVTSLTSDVYMNLGAVTIADNKIASDATTDSYAFTIAEVATGQYSICYSNGNYIGYNSSTKFKKTTTAPTSDDTAFLWTVSVSEGTLKFTNVGTTKRSIAANATSNAASLRPYDNSNIPSSNPLPDFYKLEE